MKTGELIVKARLKLNVPTNYKLSKLIDIPASRLHDYEQNRIQADAYALTRLALALELDPIEVIAEVKAEEEKNETRREFWRNFLKRAGSTGACVAALLCGWPSASEAQDMPNGNSRYTERGIMRTWRKRLQAAWSKLIDLTRIPDSEQKPQPPSAGRKVPLYVRHAV